MMAPGNGKKERTTAEVLNKKQLAEGITELVLKTRLAGYAKPGQFVGVYPDDKSMLLPRPISVCEARGEEGILHLVFRAFGTGTKRLSLLKEGESADIIGMLGNGFPVDEWKGKDILILGGGIGIPPLLFAVKKAYANSLSADSKNGKSGSITVSLGYRDSETFLYERFKDAGADCVISATDDGSRGFHGTATDAVRKAGIKADVIFACGPLPMLKDVEKLSKELDAEAFVSLEEHMACGIGACLGCVCRTKETNSHSNVKNARICTEGPVFNVKEVEL